MKAKKNYVNYGCGLTAPEQWTNFDASPSRTLQKLPIIGNIVKKTLYAPFPPNVKYGDIVKGLPVNDLSCDGVFSSHTLEHLSLEDFKIALVNTYRILKPNGIFRLVVPDLEIAAREYINSLDKGDASASFQFLGDATHLGVYKRSRGITGLLRSIFGNSHHLWMWDKQSLTQELLKAGFKNVRICSFNDCDDKMFNYVEEIYRFENSVSIECKK
jgi:predicted SAM-dependent methyltransferase